MKVLKFTEGMAPYKKGDVAGFKNEADAEPFLKADVAKEIDAPKVDKQMKSPKEDK